MRASTRTTAVVERLLDDDDVHEQLRVAGTGLRDAYRRARHLPARKAVQDRTVNDRIRQAATGITEATRRAAGKPPPEPPRRHRRALLLVMLGAGAVVVWAHKRRDEAAQAGAVGTHDASTSAPNPTAA